MEDKHFKVTPPFLANGGEMGARIQSKDWSTTALGAIENWPPVLCTTLGIVLHAKFPMFLFWGPELLCFYNDAYRPSLGDDGKHPGALGQKAADVWAETWHIIKPIIDQVLTDANATWSEDQLIPIYRNGQLEEVYWTFSYSPVFADSIDPAGVLVVCTETTENVLYQKQIEESKNWLQFAVDGAELAVWDIDPFTNTFTGNERLKAWHGLPPGEDFTLETGIGRVLETDRAGLEQAIAEALDFSSGGLLDHEYTVVNPQNGQTRIVRAYGKTSFREDKTAYQLNGILQDVTTSAINQKRIEQNEQNLRSMILQAPFAMSILRGRDYVVEIANPHALALWGRKEADVLNKPILEAMPELRTQGVKELLDQVYTTGQRFATTEMPFQLMRNGALQTAYINFSFEPLYSAAGTIDGIMPVGIEVTELVLARRKVEENEQRLNLVIESSELGTWEWHLDTDTIIYSEKYLEIFELPLSDAYDHSALLNKVHPEDIPKRNAAAALALETGHLYYEARIKTDDNRVRWYEAKGKLFYDHTQQPQKFIGTVRDITDAKTYQQELEARESEFRLLADTMPQLVWVSDKDGKVHFYNQRITEFAGVTQLPDGSWHWENMMHPDDMDGTNEAWKNALIQGKNYVKEHRIKLKNGEYRWHLSRAFPQKDSDGNITQWYGTATDIHEQKTFAVELEKQVQERTKELADSVVELEKMNKELQAFAYISSHDLQEPLRKIQTFADRIIEKEYSSLSDKAKDYFTRMQRSAGRMQALIDDLLVYSRTNTTERVFVNTDLRQIIEEIKDDLSEELKNKQAMIETDITCNADIIPFQFRQLLYNFISNSLKFARPDLPAHIVIKGEAATGSELNYDKLLPDSKYCHITFSDNGIGFDNKYSEKIFEVFQRLHGKGEYAGTGIGLAIVKKIVENHHGFITAHGEPGKGATFNIYIPAL